MPKLLTINADGTSARRDLNDEQVNVLLELGVIFLESGKGDNEQYMPKPGSIDATHDAMSFLEGILFYQTVLLSLDEIDNPFHPESPEGRAWESANE